MWPVLSFLWLAKSKGSCGIRKTLVALLSNPFPLLVMSSQSTGKTGSNTSPPQSTISMIASFLLSRHSMWKKDFVLNYDLMLDHDHGEGSLMQLSTAYIRPVQRQSFQTVPFLSHSFPSPVIHNSRVLQQHLAGAHQHR